MTDDGGTDDVMTDDGGTDDAGTVSRGFLEALWSGDKAAAKSFFSDRAEWWFLPSLGYRMPMPCSEAIDIVMDDMIGRFDLKKPFTVELHHLLVDQGEVAAEYTATATTLSGRSYRHRYLMRISVEGQKIISVRPWADTKYFLETLFGD